MKTKYIFLILCFLGIAMGSCKDDSASNPTFADDELYIYTDMLESVSAIAGTLTEFPILVSPDPLRMRRNLPGRTTQETIQDYLRIPAI